MTEKRFYSAESHLTDGYCVFDREKKYAFHPRSRKADCLNDAFVLNELHEKNEQLKKENKDLKYRLNKESNEKMGLEEYINRLLKNKPEFTEMR